MSDPSSPSAPAPTGSSSTPAAPRSEPHAEAWRSGWPPMSYWARWLLTLAAIGTVLYALYDVRNVVILVLIAAVLAIGLDPAIRWIERRGRSRGRAVALISLAAVALVASFAWVVVPKLVTQVGELADGIPGYIASLQRRDDVIGRYFREQDFSDRLKDFVADLPERISSSFDTILGVAKGVGSTVFNVLTVAILAIYFMVGLPQMRRSGAILFDPTYRERAEAILDQAIMRIGGYVAGILTTASIAGISALVFLSILNVIGIGVPFALPLSIFSALMGLIPAVGAYIGAAPAVLLGYIESPLTGTVILVYFIVYQQIENYVIQPRVMKDAVNLSPAAVVVSTLIFGSLGGVVGALLALPAAATIKVVFVEVVLRSRMEEGDTEAAAQLREHLEAEAEAKAEAQARAESRRRWFRRIKERLGPRKDDSST